MAFQKTVVGGASAFALSVLAVKPVAAEISAQIALRGIVPPRAVVALGNVAGSGAIEFARATRSGTAVVDLSGMGNSMSRVDIRLIASVAAEKRNLALVAADGSSIPYRVRFEGKELDLGEDGASLERTNGAEGLGSLEVVAPGAARVTQDYSDHLVIVVTAR